MMDIIKSLFLAGGTPSKEEEMSEEKTQSTSPEEILASEGEAWGKSEISEENPASAEGGDASEGETSEENKPCAEDTEHISEEKPILDYTLTEIAQLRQKTGSDDVLKDVLSEEFAIFSDGRSGSLEEKYVSFASLKALMKEGSPKKGDDEAQEPSEDVGARLHSGFSGASYRSSGQGLTRRQMDMAKSAGMSFKEYESLLEGAPVGRRQSF